MILRVGSSFFSFFLTGNLSDSIVWQGEGQREKLKEIADGGTCQNPKKVLANEGIKGRKEGGKPEKKQKNKKTKNKEQKQKFKKQTKTTSLRLAKIFL